MCWLINFSRKKNESVPFPYLYKTYKTKGDWNIEEDIIQRIALIHQRFSDLFRLPN